MPIDPSIIMGYRPTAPLMDPMEAMGRIGQLRQMQQTQAMHDLQMQQNRIEMDKTARAQADEQKKREIAIASGGDTKKLISGLMGAGFRQDAMAIQKQMADIGKEEVEAQSKGYDMDMKRIGRLGAAVNALQTKPDLSHNDIIQTVKNEVAMKTITPEQGNAYIAQAMSSQDPRQFVTQAGLALMDAEKRMTMMAPKYRDIGGQFVPENQLTGKPFEGLTPIQKTMTPEQIESSKIAKGHLAIAQAKERREREAEAMGNTVALDPQAAFDSLSPADQALVKQLAERKIMVGRAGGFQINSPRNQKLYSIAVGLNPALSVIDNETAKKFMADLGSSSPQSAGGRIDSANRMIGHAGELLNLLEKDVKPGSGVTGRLGNIVAYPMQRFAGNAGAVEFVKNKLLAEVNKLVTGGVPHAKEMEEDIKNTPITATKEQWAKLIKTIVDVGTEQTNALQEKRRNILGTMDPGTSMLSPTARKTLERINKYAGYPAPEMPESTSTGYSRPAQEGAAYGAGKTGRVESKVNPANGKTYYKHPDGNYYLEPPR